MFEIRDDIYLAFSHFKNTAILRDLHRSSVCVSIWMKKALHKENRIYIPYFNIYLLCLL